MGEMIIVVVLVTGVGPGIGLATAVTLAREGADVAASARPSTTCWRSCGRVTEHGRRALPIMSVSLIGRRTVAFDKRPSPTRAD